MKTRKAKRCKTCGKDTYNVTFLCSGCERIKEVSEANRPEGYNKPQPLVATDKAIAKAEGKL